MTRTEPAQVKYTKRLKAVQCCLSYYQNLLNQLSWFYYKKLILVIQKQLSPF